MANNNNNKLKPLDYNKLKELGKKFNNPGLNDMINRLISIDEQLSTTLQSLMNVYKNGELDDSINQLNETLFQYQKNAIENNCDTLIKKITEEKEKIIKQLQENEAVLKSTMTKDNQKLLDENTNLRSQLAEKEQELKDIQKNINEIRVELKKKEEDMKKITEDSEKAKIEWNQQQKDLQDRLNKTLAENHELLSKGQLTSAEQKRAMEKIQSNYNESMQEYEKRLEQYMKERTDLNSRLTELQRQQDVANKQRNEKHIAELKKQKDECMEQIRKKDSDIKEINTRLEQLEANKKAEINKLNAQLQESNEMISKLINANQNKIDKLENQIVINQRELEKIKQEKNKLNSQKEELERNNITNLREKEEIQKQLDKKTKDCDDQIKILEDSMKQMRDGIDKYMDEQKQRFDKELADYKTQTDAFMKKKEMEYKEDKETLQKQIKECNDKLLKPTPVSKPSPTTAEETKIINNLNQTFENSGIHIEGQPTKSGIICNIHKDNMSVYKSTNQQDITDSILFQQFIENNENNFTADTIYVKDVSSDEIRCRGRECCKDIVLKIKKDNKHFAVYFTPSREIEYLINPFDKITTFREFESSDNFRFYVEHTRNQMGFDEKYEEERKNKYKKEEERKKTLTTEIKKDSDELEQFKSIFNNLTIGFEAGDPDETQCTKDLMNIQNKSEPIQTLKDFIESNTQNFIFDSLYLKKLVDDSQCTQLQCCYEVILVIYHNTNLAVRWAVIFEPQQNNVRIPFKEIKMFDIKLSDNVTRMDFSTPQIKELMTVDNYNKAKEFIQGSSINIKKFNLKCQINFDNSNVTINTLNTPLMLLRHFIQQMEKNNLEFLNMYYQYGEWSLATKTVILGVGLISAVALLKSLGPISHKPKYAEEVLKIIYNQQVGLHQNLNIDYKTTFQQFLQKYLVSDINIDELKNYLLKLYGLALTTTSTSTALVPVTKCKDIDCCYKIVFEFNITGNNQKCYFVFIPNQGQIQYSNSYITPTNNKEIDTLNFFNWPKLTRDQYSKSLPSRGKGFRTEIGGGYYPNNKNNYKKKYRIKKDIL